MFEKFKAKRKYNKLVAEGNAAADNCKELLDIFEESLHKYSPMIQKCLDNKEKVIEAMMKAQRASVGDTENVYAVVYDPVLIDEITHEDEGRMLDLSEYGCGMFCIPQDGTDDIKSILLKSMESHDLVGAFHIWLAFFNNETEMEDGELKALCEELYETHLKTYAAKLRVYAEALYHESIDKCKKAMKSVYETNKADALKAVKAVASASPESSFVKISERGIEVCELKPFEVDIELYNGTAVVLPVKAENRELTDAEAEEIYNATLGWFDEPTRYNSKCVVGRNVAMYEQLRLTTDKLVKSITIGN